MKFKDIQIGLQAFQNEDYETAIRVLTPWAEQGNPEAQSKLGRCYENFRGIVRDNIEAAKWYRLAAEQGNADAQNHLGSLYVSGRGVVRDNIEAVKWFRLAAEQGNADAQLKMGNAYLLGYGDVQKAEAVKWFRLAAEQGNADARQILTLFNVNLLARVPQKIYAPQKIH
jgi:uncharacterized protein